MFVVVNYSLWQYTYLFEFGYIPGANPFISVTVMLTVTSLTFSSNDTSLVSRLNSVITPDILIIADLSEITQDLLEARYTVTYSKLYTCGLGCYNGFTQHLTNTNSIKQTLFYLVPLNIGNSVIGSDQETLLYKIAQTPFGSNVIPLILYALLKMILGRVLFGKFDIKWLYRDYYRKLIKVTIDSDYRIFYEDFLKPDKSYEQYFKYNPN